MLKSKIMIPQILYRTEQYSGSGKRDAVDVLTFEVFDLRNTDILEYCLSHYDLRRMHFDITIRTLMDIIQDNDDVEEKDIRTIMKDLLKHIELNTGHCIRYILWLASKDEVKDNYEGTEGCIDAYKTGPVILSDLGNDGILFGYDNLPEKITS